MVGSFLDFEELARRALARHWDGLTAKQRADFVKTLRELVERNYVKQLHGQPDYDLRLDERRRPADEATVWGTLHATAKGKKVTMALEYKLVRKGNRWVVYDVITDELSLLENYRAEFNKVIAKESLRRPAGPDEEEAGREVSGGRGRRRSRAAIAALLAALLGVASAGCDEPCCTFDTQPIPLSRAASAASCWPASPGPQGPTAGSDRHRVAGHVLGDERTVGPARVVRRDLTLLGPPAALSPAPVRAVFTTC